jgi:lambda repressor-like predicted transcriptional regulator
VYRSGVPSGPDRRSKIARLHQQGLSLRELASRFGVSYWTVRNELLACQQMPPKKILTKARVN